MLAVLQCGDSFELVAAHRERGEQVQVKQEMTCEARVAMQLKCKRIVDIAELNPSLILSYRKYTSGSLTLVNVANKKLH